MSSDLTLITGASGLVGSAVALEFLKQGHQVRLAFRKASQGDEWNAKYPEYKSQVQFAVVPDLAADGAFDDAIKGVKLVAHVAAPVLLAPKSPREDVIDPAINANLVLLKAAKASGSVRAVVVTSSSATNFRIDQMPPAGVTVGPQDWADFTYESAIKYTEAEGLLSYSAAKTLAERAAWDFVAKEKPGFTLTTVSPVTVFGHNYQASLRSWADVASASTWGWVSGAIVDQPSIGETPPVVSQFVDPEDIARAHYAAVTKPLAAGKRYLLSSGSINFEEVARLAVKAVPELASRVASTAGAPFAETFWYDGSAAEKDLGITYQTLEQSSAKWAKQIESLPKA